MAATTERVIETPVGRFSYAFSGSGPPRLILHSLLTDRTAFDAVAEGLGGQTFALDLPGFGATDPARPDIDDYAHRVAGFIEDSGFGPDLVLIGNGLGAFVSLGTVIHHPGLATRAILVGCGTGFPQAAKGAFVKMIETARTGGMEAVVPIALRRIFTDDFLTANPDVAEERARILGGHDPEAFINACQALITLDYAELASTVTIPTLIVVGEDDQATPPPLAMELHRVIPDSTLALMPGMAHAPQLQDPEGFIETIRPFMEGEHG